MPVAPNLFEQALAIARLRGMARAREFRAAGIPPSYLSRLCDQGLLVRQARGLYQLAEPEEFHAAHSLAEAASLAPHGVVSLLSALNYHEMTTQLPHAVWMTIAHKARAPRSFPFRSQITHASGAAFAAGRITVVIERVHVAIYDPAKTIVDCFKHRNRVGLDVAMEALRDGIRQRKATMDAIWRYAGICRMQNVMRPYLESLV